MGNDSYKRVFPLSRGPAELYELYVDAYYEDPTVALDPSQIKLEPVFKEN